MSLLRRSLFQSLSLSKSHFHSLELEVDTQNEFYRECLDLYYGENSRVNLFSIQRNSAVFDVPFSYAVARRLEYLRERLYCWLGWESGEGHIYPSFGSYESILQEMIELSKRRKKIRSTDTITASMIAEAEAYPIANLIEFGRDGKTPCPFHDDKSPSMFHAYRKNIAQCPVCNSGWGTIRLLMERDKMTFKEAVKRCLE